jgi:hypothetical protein
MLKAESLFVILEEFATAYTIWHDERVLNVSEDVPLFVSILEKQSHHVTFVLSLVSRFEPI